MKTVMKRFWLLPLLAVLFSSCQREMSTEDGNGPVTTPRYNVSFLFEHTVAGSPLVLNTATYTNAHNESYTLRTFRYYISNIELINTVTGKSSKAENLYKLVDHAATESRSFQVGIEEGSYNRIRFLIGVDSTRNVSGAQTDALDPAKGMFWTWNSGYVMAKLEGNSDAATTPNKEFTYHIGGFRTGESALRTVTFDLPAGNMIEVNAGTSGYAVFSADVNTWFSRVHSLPIAGTGFVHSPGAIAMQYADNYSGMFTLMAAGNP